MFATTCTSTTLTLIGAGLHLDNRYPLLIFNESEAIQIAASDKLYYTEDEPFTCRSEGRATGKLKFLVMYASLFHYLHIVH